MRFTIRDLTYTALGASLTAALAWVIIPFPFTPVPISGQTIGVMLCGALLPPKLAALSQLTYILLGLIGLPVFAGGGSGPGTLFGPTGGYIWAFVVASYSISLGLRCTKRRNNIITFGILFLGGVVIINAIGVAYLMYLTRLSLVQVLTSSVLPFLPGDIGKVLLVGILARRRDNFRAE